MLLASLASFMPEISKLAPRLLCTTGALRTLPSNTMARRSTPGRILLVRSNILLAPSGLSSTVSLPS